MNTADGKGSWVVPETKFQPRSLGEGDFIIGALLYFVNKNMEFYCVPPIIGSKKSTKNLEKADCTAFFCATLCFQWLL